MLHMVLNAERPMLESTASQDSAESEGSDGDGALLKPWPGFAKRTARWTEEQLCRRESRAETLVGKGLQRLAWIPGAMGTPGAYKR